MPTLVPTDASMAHRLAVQLLGLVAVATGVACTIRAELGVAPYDVVTTGMHELLDIPIGVAAMLLPLVFLVLGRALGGRVGVGSVLDVVLVGPVLGLVLDRAPGDRGDWLHGSDCSASASSASPAGSCS